MAKKMNRLSEEDLERMGLEQIGPDQYRKKKTRLQPREIAAKKKIKAHDKSGTFPDISKIAKQSKSFELDYTPMGKPRMTQQDKWKVNPNHEDPKKRQRPAITKYWKYKDALKAAAEKQCFVMPECNYHMIFYIPVSASWSKKKKVLMDKKPHKHKPDKDNLEKAVLDCLCKEDSGIWDGRVTKYWTNSEVGKIIIKPIS